MALKLKCRCGEKLSAPESAAGKKGKCPKCGMTFVIPGGPAAATASPSAARQPAAAPAKSADPFGLDLPDLPPPGPLDDLFDQSFSAEAAGGTTLVDHNPFASPLAPAKAKPSRGGSRAGMNKVANGIKLVFWGTLLAVGSMALAFIGGAIATLTSPELLPILALAVLALQFVGALLSVVGRVICLAVPPQVGGKLLIIGCVLLDAIGIGLGAMVGLNERGQQNSALNLAMVLAGFATFILFLLFVRKVALYLKQRELADDAMKVLVMIGVAIVSAVAGGVLMSMGSVVLPCVGILFVLGVIMFTVIKYLNLLQYTAEAARC